MTGTRSKSSRMRRTLLALFAGAGLLVLVSDPHAFAQSTDNVRARVERLERDIETLSRAVFKGEKPPAGALSGGDGGVDGNFRASLEVRLSRMEEDIRALTGRLEQQSHDIQTLQERVERSLTDTEMRLQDMERRGGGAAGATGAQPAAGGPVGGGEVGMTTINPGAGQAQRQLGSLTQPGGGAVEPQSASVAAGPNDPAAIYDNAFTLLRSGNYADAQRQFERFLKDNPKHDLASNAKYWLGESYYARNDYDKAARMFAQGYESAPKGTKAPDNLLKMGLSLSQLGRKAEACQTLAFLKEKFPTGATPVMQRAEQERVRLSCK